MTWPFQLSLTTTIASTEREKSENEKATWARCQKREKMIKATEPCRAGFCCVRFFVNGAHILLLGCSIAVCEFYNIAQRLLVYAGTWAPGISCELVPLIREKKLCRVLRRLVIFVLTESDSCKNVLLCFLEKIKKF